MDTTVFASDSDCDYSAVEFVRAMVAEAMRCHRTVARERKQDRRKQDGGDWPGLENLLRPGTINAMPVRNRLIVGPMEKSIANPFIMALFLSTADIKTLPVAIWPQIRYLLTPIVAAASTVIIVITVVLLLAAAKATNIRRLVEFR